MKLKQRKQQINKNKFNVIIKYQFNQIIKLLIKSKECINSHELNITNLKVISQLIYCFDEWMN